MGEGSRSRSDGAEEGRGGMTLSEKSVGAPTVFLFSYGTLQYPGVQMASFGRLLEGADDRMTGYRREMVEVTDAEVLVKSCERFHPIAVASTNANDAIS